MGIYLFEVNQEDRRYLESSFFEEQLHFCEEPLTRLSQVEEIADKADIVSVFVHSKVTSEMIDALPHLGLIATRSTGFDHVNVAAAGARGIPVCNVPTYGENTVAEHTFALILALSRNVHKAYMRTAQGDYSLAGLQGFDLKGRTLGIVGTGHIGTRVAKIAKGFEMDVIAFDPQPNQAMADILDYEYTSLDDLLQRSDIVTLHAPLCSSTHHLIGEHNIHRLKRAALLINTARGELIDTGALLKALDSKHLSGAGLDVLEGENNLNEETMMRADDSVSREALVTTLRNLALMRRHDLVVTPHIAYDSREAINRILTTTVDNIRAFRHGAPRNVVEP
jgi:D-lactate dehydrogenase